MQWLTRTISSCATEDYLFSVLYWRANKVGDHVLVGQEQSRLLELLTQLQLKIDGVKVSNLTGCILCVFTFNSCLRQMKQCTKNAYF